MRPFLKWAGGKKKIAKRIKSILPSGTRLIEPFVGSGAVFLNTDYSQYLLADINVDLINLYLILQKEGGDFIDYAEQFFVPENNEKQTYYMFRNQFNTTSDERLKSALFLYLNRHGFNGLCRYNLSGGFNVPFGTYKKPYFPKKEMFFFHKKSQKAVFQVADFERTMKMAKTGDVVYCDPPYVPLSDSANFTSYSSGKFSIEEQLKLARLAEKLAKQGIPVAISNHSTDLTQKEYAEASDIITFDVQRYISSNGSNRNKVRELIAFYDGQLI